MRRGWTLVVVVVALVGCVFFSIVTSRQVGRKMATRSACLSARFVVQVEVQVRRVFMCENFS